jgi:tetraacyldisaccharide 4'-kinase
MQTKAYISKLRLFLLPLSFVYFMVTGVRNILFYLKVLPSHLFPLPILSVGNITVGGTGKTPHTELLIEMLKNKYEVAVLSRGYKRKSKGFILADIESTTELLGDEPFLIYKKHDVTVCVCEDRVLGVKELLKAKNEIQIILLDDAFQHRYLKPGLSILLIDFNRPVFSDFLLPAGNLRESALGINRADIVIITKAPKQINFETKKYWQSKLKLEGHQKLYFTHFNYGELHPVFHGQNTSLNALREKNIELLVVTGIAQPKPLVDFLQGLGFSCELLPFSDHHDFSSIDLLRINDRFKKMDGQNKLIITTEKDSVRFLQLSSFPEDIKDKLFYLPVRVEFSDGLGEEFSQTIHDFIQPYFS